MKINNILWDEVSIIKISTGEIQEFKSASISCDEILKIQEYTSSQGVNTGKGCVLGHPKLIKLSPWEIEFQAFWDTEEYRILAQF